MTKLQTIKGGNFLRHSVFWSVRRSKLMVTRGQMLLKC